MQSCVLTSPDRTSVVSFIAIHERGITPPDRFTRVLTRVLPGTNELRSEICEMDSKIAATAHTVLTSVGWTDITA